jgi:adenylate kinase
LLRRVQGRVECPECRWTGQSGQLVDDGRCPVCGEPAGRRPDDDEANFRARHAAYETLALPVVGYYESRGIVSRCDATAAPDEVAARLLRLFPSPAADR